ncbi:hypothetical protein NDU88_003078 [Pleurodeles waltl]|uniref:Uncharacterized protein n=1 Tax=Pleurodeles waltl TaxID=8319 RepID=A0AAV7M2W9_PLEWA|nr:hypothetical protein NDU88_003078 [Pleurodeles waltl]
MCCAVLLPMKQAVKRYKEAGQPTRLIGRELRRLRLVSPGPRAVRRWGGVDGPPPHESGIGRGSLGEAKPVEIPAGERRDARRGSACRPRGEMRPCGPALDERNPGSTCGEAQPGEAQFERSGWSMQRPPTL